MKLIRCLGFIHYNNLHLKKEGMRKKILDAVFFWAGYNNAVQAFIEKFGA